MHNAKRHNIKTPGEMRKNPFVYGAIVRGRDFADRREELVDITNEMVNSQKVVLISPRRYGKSSLIQNVLTRMNKKGYYTLYLDLYKALSLHKLLEMFAQGIAAACETKIDRAIKFIQETIPRLRPTVTVESSGKTSISLDLAPSTKNLLSQFEDILDAPQKIAEKRKKRFVVVFDEFQEVMKLNGDTIEKMMRAVIQNHTRVGYLFAGSKKHLLYQMVSDQSRPFYKLGRTITLGKMPEQEFSAFLKKKFIKTGFKLEADVIDRVFELSCNVPYNTQYLCHRVWNLCRASRRINSTHVDSALNAIINEETPIYLGIWDSLTLHQRQVLHAIAVAGSDKIFSKDYVRINNLGSAASVQTSLRLLIKKNIIDKTHTVYSFTDVFFRQWITKKI